MTKPRIHILALGGTIATRPDSTGAMQMGLGADDLVAAVPLLKNLAEIEAETVSRVGSHSLSFDQIHALAAKIRGLKADGVVVDARHRHAGGDELPARPAARRRRAGDRDGGDAQSVAHLARRCRATCWPPCGSRRDPWVRKHAKALGVLAVMLDEVYAAADVLKVHPTRLNAFASTQTGPLAALVEDRDRAARRCRCAMRSSRRARSSRGALDGKAAPVALFWMALDDDAASDVDDARGVRPCGLSRRGDRRDGRRPYHRAFGRQRPSPRQGDADRDRAARRRGGPMLRQTYGGPSAEIELRRAGLIWGGRLHPLKARVLLETCLRAGLDRAAISRTVRRVRLGAARELRVGEAVHAGLPLQRDDRALDRLQQPDRQAEDQRQPTARRAPSRPGV